MTRAIEITFPVHVELPRDVERELHAMLDHVCKLWTRANPGRVMWVGGYGGKITSMPITAEDDRNGVPLEFDMETLAIECTERADYDWPCARCGRPQDDHRDHTLTPAAGDCDFAPMGRTEKALVAKAAPELLEALKTLHAKTIVGSDAERHAALASAWAAITKAMPPASESDGASQ